MEIAYERAMRLEEERRSLEPMLHIPHGKQSERVKELSEKIDALLLKRRVLEEGARYGGKNGLRNDTSQAYEEESLRFRRNFYLTLSVLLTLGFFILL